MSLRPRSMLTTVIALSMGLIGSAIPAGSPVLPPEKEHTPSVKGLRYKSKALSGTTNYTGAASAQRAKRKRKNIKLHPRSAHRHGGKNW
jgi:hypothetical protein